MKFTPAKGFIAVQVQSMQKSAMGIYIPDNALTDRLSKAIVVGTNITTTPTGDALEPEYKLNDNVIFVKGSGYPFKVDGIDLILLKNEEVMGTFTE